MKKEFCQTMTYVLTAAMLVGIATPSSSAAAKAKAPKLSNTKLSVKEGEKKTIKVKNAKKVTWSVKSGKKYVTLSNKKKTSVVVKGKKAGKAVVIAKSGKKTLSCKVTVSKKTSANTNTPKVTPTAPATDNKGTPAPTATATASDEPESVKNVVIDLSKVGDTTFTQSPAFIDFSDQIEDRIDLSLFKELKVGYELQFEGEDTSLLTGGKIGLANKAEDLTGFANGIAFTYNMMPGSTSVSVPLEETVTGKPVGINVQPMDAGASYAWPASLVSVTITSIELVAREGAVYGTPGTPGTPKPTATPVAPEFESSEFKYEGLDQKWIDENIDPSKPVVAMTFDDGPGGYNEFVDYGMQIQKALKDAGAHATFFYIGAHIARDEQTRNEVEEAWKAGFEVANHSYDSNGLNGVDATTVKEKIVKTDELLAEITGYKSFLFRAPNVAYSPTMFAVIDKPFIDVSIWSNDWNDKVGKDEVVKNVIDNLADGGIINMHSVHEKTAQAVPEILDYCKKNGYQVVSVSELFAIKGQKLMTGVKYGKAN